ncbi:MAG: PAS domain S-box protein [Candidatus Cloacimonetes bacterium]|nr:PAS domain S-box protein [Candidatus Cloacimonadota bacterium]
MSKTRKYRILIADDEITLHRYYERVLKNAKSQKDEELSNLEKELFKNEIEESIEIEYDITFCTQGEEAVKIVNKSVMENNPFALILIDVFMPPGKGGIWAAEEIRKTDKQVHISFITAYSDTDITEIAKRIPPADKLLFTVKPAHPQEIIQLVNAMTTKWYNENELNNIRKQLTNEVSVQKKQLIEANQKLDEELIQKKNLREMLKNHTQMMESLDEIIIFTDENLIINDINQAFEKKLMFTKQDIIDKKINLIWASKDNPPETVISKVEESLFWFGEIKIINKTNKLKWFFITVKPLSSEKKGFMFIGSDINDKVNKERIIIQQKILFEDIFTRIQEGLVILDAEGRIILANQSFCKIIDSSYQDIVNKKFVDFFAEDEKIKISKELYDNKLKESISVETVYTDSQGRKKNFLITGYPRLNQNGEFVGTFEIIQDITESKNLENKFIHFQKMEAMGRLAGGIAHDFNNYLTVITSATEVMNEKKGNTDPEFDKYLSVILSTTQKAAELTNQLLIFSNRSKLKKKTLSINEIVEKSMKMLIRLIGSDVEFKINLQPDLSNVFADENMIRQILLNLSVNAKETMPMGGVISISSKSLTISKETVAIYSSAKTDSFICLTVKDNGAGMSEDEIKQVFEPFYSSNSVEKHTGLGLTTVLSIAQDHGGWVNIESKRGKGTIFTVYLPAESSEHQSDNLTEKIEFSELESDSTILLLEDDEFVRKYTASALRSYGFKVIESTDIIHARNLFKDNADEIDTVISDYYLCDGSGIMFLEEILKKKPNIKTRLITGYTLDEDQLRMIDDKGIQLLYKPYNIRELIDFISCKSMKNNETENRCELYNVCTFLKKFNTNSNILSGWTKMFCDKFGKSQRCERKKYYYKTGNQPVEDMTPTGKFLDKEV